MNPLSFSSKPSSKDPLDEITTRDDMIRYFDGYSEERKDELQEKKLKQGLVKTYMFETMNGQSKDYSELTVPELINIPSINFRELENDLFKVFDTTQMKCIGFIERMIGNRYFAFYTTEDSKFSDPWMKKQVRNSPYIDHLWLSGWTFNIFWDIIRHTISPDRFINIRFEHESIFDRTDQEQDVDREMERGRQRDRERDGLSVREEFGEEDEGDDEAEETDDDSSGDTKERKIAERRTTRFIMMDRKGVIEEILGKFQDLYDPLYSITSMRIPSPVSRGGHDIYYDGKVTNRSDSFRDHRAHVLAILRMYDRIISTTEEMVWFSLTEDVTDTHRSMTGTPLTIEFKKDGLSPSTFNHFIESTFMRSGNRFRLWGNPIHLGPAKVHIYGVDQHLWQPIYLEITLKHIKAIIPEGTCGNTVHRLVTNVQKYLDPAAEAYLGETEYKDLIRKATGEF